MPSLLDLPMDFQISLLSHLKFCDLTQCRRACKSLLRIIDSSPQLQVIIELGASARKENPAYDHQETTAWKLAQIKTMNLAWANLHYNCGVQIKIDGHVRQFEFSGGCFFYTVFEVPNEEDDEGEDEEEGPCSKVYWIRLPSRRNHVPSSPQLIRLVGFVMHDMVFDVPRDLFIGISMKRFHAGKEFIYELQIRPVSITTGRQHPDAQHRDISLRFSSKRGSDYFVTAHISGNHIGLLLTRDLRHSTSKEEESRGQFDLFILWDWTTGVCKANMSSFDTCELWESFCFISLDSVLIPSTVDGCLNIFRFNEKPNSLTHVFTFILPETIVNPGLRHIRVFSNSAPSLPRLSECRNPTGDVPPFVADPDDGVVILQLDYYHPHRDYIRGVSAETEPNHPQVVAVLRRCFLRALEIEIPKLYIPGKEHYGSLCRHLRTHFDSLLDPQTKRHPHVHPVDWLKYTRWGLEPMPPFLWSHCTYGSRYLGMTSRLVRPQLITSKLVVYDFNTRNERRGVNLTQLNVRFPPHITIDKNNEKDILERAAKGEWPKLWPMNQSQFVSNKKLVGNPDIFVRAFETPLPYRITESEFVFHWNSALIDEERIIGVILENRAIRALDVLVI